MKIYRALALVLLTACADSPAPTALRAIDAPTPNAVAPGSGTWKPAGAMAHNRYWNGGAAVNGRFYAIGGSTALITADPTVERYNPSTNSWSYVAPMPEARANAATAVWNGKIYVFGGLDDQFLTSRSVWIYDPAGNAWTEGPTAPTPRYAQSAVTIGDLIYVVGGVGPIGITEGIVGTLHVFDPVNGTWVTRATNPHPAQYGFAFASEGDLIFASAAIGGSSNVDRYNVITNTWSAGPPTTFPGANGLHGGTVDGITYVFWFDWNDGYLKGQAYNPATNTWVPLQPTAASHVGYTSGAGVIGHKIFLSGGYRTDLAPSNATTETWAFTPGQTGNHAPVLAVNTPWDAVFEGTGFIFDASASTDPDGDPLTYQWDFGDGNTSTVAAPNHAYENDGTYSVSLTISDGTLQQSITRSVKVRNAVPTLDPSVLADAALVHATWNQTVTFTDPGTDSWSITVNYDDGAGRESVPVPGDFQIDLSHQYDTPGLKNVVVAVTDDHSAIGKSHLGVYVYGEIEFLRLMKAVTLSVVSDPTGQSRLERKLTGVIQQVQNTDWVAAIAKMNEFKALLATYPPSGGVDFGAAADLMIAALTWELNQA
jgi:N-acetylneuraminic acid mutarotase